MLTHCAGCLRDENDRQGQHTHQDLTIEHSTVNMLRQSIMDTAKLLGDQRAELARRQKEARMKSDAELTETIRHLTRGHEVQP